MNNAISLLKKAQADLQKGNAVRAEKHCRKLLKDKTLYLQVRLLLAKVMTQQNRLKDAALFMAEAANHDTSQTQLQMAAGEMLNRVGMFEDAQPFLERAVTAQPTNSNAWFALLSGMASDILNPTRPNSKDKHHTVPADLVQLAQKLQNNFPDALKMIALIGEIYLANGQVDAAENCFHQALSARPYIPAAHHNWLKLHLEALDHEAILAYDSEHGEVVAQDALCQRTIAASLENLGFFDKALERLNIAIGLCTNNAPRTNEYLAARGRVHFYLGKFNEALEDLSKSLKAKPDFLDARHNRCLTNKCLGNIGAAAQDEFARLKMDNKHATFDFEKPIWNGEPLTGKRLFIWSDMGVGDTFKYTPLIRELSKDGHIILAAQPKTLAFLKTVLPEIEMRDIPKQKLTMANNRINLHNINANTTGIATFDPIEEDFDYHMPLAGLYTILRPDMASFKHLTRAFSLPEAIIEPYRQLDCMKNPQTTKVGLAWSSKSKNPMVERNYLTLEDLLPILRMPGFEFYNLQYSAGEDEIKAFSKKHSVPLHHAPGLDLMDDMLGTAAFTSCMDLFISPANTCCDIAGTMGVKSHRTDLIHLPESLGKDYVPWYEDQKCLRIPWGRTVLDYLPQMQDWLMVNKDHRGKHHSL